MLFEEAIKKMFEVPRTAEAGYMVRVNVVSGTPESGLKYTSFHFPDKHKGEHLIGSEEDAWALAELFGILCKDHRFTIFNDPCYRIEDIYVIGHDFRPVKNYDKRTIVLRKRDYKK